MTGEAARRGATKTADTLADALRGLDGVVAFPAVESDLVAGVRPLVVAQPRSVDAVGATLAFANRERLSVLIRGGGTQLGLGFPPTSGDILLDMGALSGVVEHTPNDMTATFLAGTPLADIQQTLAGAGQWLALDPALPSAATIGGIVATNASGPRRLRYGGVRDQIIGVSMVRADGASAKGGGKVVKNVAGYDLPKLITGSLGTLGVVVSTTFRLYPREAASRTVLFSAVDVAPLCALVVDILATTLVPSALDIVGRDGDSLLAARFEAVAAAADEQVRSIVELAARPGIDLVGIMGDHEEDPWWRRATFVADGSSGDSADAWAIVKASLLPAEVGPWVQATLDLCRRRRVSIQWRAHAGHGLVWARFSGDEASIPVAISGARDLAFPRGGSLVVVDAPPSITGHVDVWGPVESAPLMRRIKAQFDPAGILNPGRFVERI